VLVVQTVEFCCVCKTFVVFVKPVCFVKLLILRVTDVYAIIAYY